MKVKQLVVSWHMLVPARCYFASGPILGASNLVFAISQDSRLSLLKSFQTTNSIHVWISESRQGWRYMKPMMQNLYATSPSIHPNQRAQWRLEGGWWRGNPGCQKKWFIVVGIVLGLVIMGAVMGIVLRRRNIAPATPSTMVAPSGTPTSVSEP